MSKRCTLIPVDADVQRRSPPFPPRPASTRRAGHAADHPLLAGAPLVGVHGDVGADGLVPNRTLVAYRIDADAPGSGETFFPALNVSGARARRCAGV